jgi:tryptophanyl-tRNA synthetase
MVTPLSWLERVPTYKEAFENVTNKDLHTYGFLGYPCLQTADIVIYSNNLPLFVPVGEDQVSHVELSREIVRKFNLHFSGLTFHQEIMDSGNIRAVEDVWAMLHRDIPNFAGLRALAGMPFGPSLQGLQFGSSTLVKQIGYENFLAKAGNAAKFIKSEVHVLEEPGVMLTKTPRIPGLDGRKMSKSYGNAITLSESDDDIRKKTKVMVTDPARKRRTDPGNPDVCPVYDWHKLFSPQETLDWAAHGCRTAGIGCIECKSKMADHLIQWIAPVRERRLEYEKHPRRVLEIIDAGSKTARAEAQTTMSRVREAVFGWDKKRNEIASGNSQ